MLSRDSYGIPVTTVLFSRFAGGGAVLPVYSLGEIGFLLVCAVGVGALKYG
jgi:hypothetical protein